MKPANGGMPRERAESAGEHARQKGGLLREAAIVAQLLNRVVGARQNGHANDFLDGDRGSRRRVLFVNVVAFEDLSGPNSRGWRAAAAVRATSKRGLRRRKSWRRKPARSRAARPASELGRSRCTSRLCRRLYSCRLARRLQYSQARSAAW